MTGRRSATTREKMPSALLLFAVFSGNVFYGQTTGLLNNYSFPITDGWTKACHWDKSVPLKMWKVHFSTLTRKATTMKWPGLQRKYLKRLLCLSKTTSPLAEGCSVKIIFGLFITFYQDRRRPLTLPSVFYLPVYDG